MGQTGYKPRSPEPKPAPQPTPGEETSQGGVETKEKKTNAELTEEFEKETRIRVSRRLMDEIPNENLSDIYDSIRNQIKLHPELMGNITNLSIENGNNTYASHGYWHITGKSELNINPKYYGISKEYLEKSYAEDVKSEWHPAGTKADSIVVHELGHHALFEAYNKVVPSGWDRSKVGANKFAKDLVKRAYDSLPPKTFSSLSKARYDISRYAHKNDHETIAEAWADYHANGNNAKALSKAIYNELMKYKK